MTSSSAVGVVVDDLHYFVCASFAQGSRPGCLRNLLCPAESSQSYSVQTHK